MFTGPVGPVEICFYWAKAVLGNFYCPGVWGSPIVLTLDEICGEGFVFSILKYEVHPLEVEIYRLTDLLVLCIFPPVS